MASYGLSAPSSSETEDPGHAVAVALLGLISAGISLGVIILARKRQLHWIHAFGVLTMMLLVLIITVLNLYEYPTIWVQALIAIVGAAWLILSMVLYRHALREICQQQFRAPRETVALVKSIQDDDL